MHFLNSIDYTVIVVYLSVLLALGFYLQKRASNSQRHCDESNACADFTCRYKIC